MKTSLTGDTVLVAVLALTGLSGCGGSAPAASATTATSASATTATSASAATPASALTVRDQWVKSAGRGEMTAAFGTLVNGTDHDLTVVSATSTVSPMELHEMAMQGGKMVMRPKQGGFVIKAGATHDLSPGGDHLMLMKPSEAIQPGDEVSFTLTLDDAKTVTFTAVAKPFAGAGESYAPSASPTASTGK
jgi:periplasmic copper chaperone A